MYCAQFIIIQYILFQIVCSCILFMLTFTEVYTKDYILIFGDVVYANKRTYDQVSTQHET